MRSRQYAFLVVLGFLRFEISKNGERVGTIIARLAVRLGDVRRVGYSDTPYFFCRNRDLGTISVYMGYRDVRCLPPYMHMHMCMHMCICGKNTYIVR